MSQPTEHYRGTYLPVELIRLYEAGTLNAEEVLLLAKIDALQDPKRGGCWASNGWLGVWWKKTPRWVSSTVQKFEKLGLVTVIQKSECDRTIVTALAPRKKTSCPQEESFLPPRKKTSTKIPLREIEEDTVSGDTETLVPVQPEYSEAVSAFATFSRQRGYHIRSRTGKEVSYAKGGGPGGWTTVALKRWEEIHQALCRHHHPEKIRRLVLRLIKYYDSDYAPEVRTFSAFAEKFEKVEKFVKRERAIRVKQGEEDPEEAPYDDPMAAPNIRTQEAKLLTDEDVAEIDGDWRNGTREE